MTLSSTMLFAWSLSGFIVPGIGTMLTALYGTQSFIYVAIADRRGLLPVRRLAVEAGRGGAGRGDRQLRADDRAGAAARRSRLRLGR